MQEDWIQSSVLDSTPSTKGITPLQSQECSQHKCGSPPAPKEGPLGVVAFKLGGLGGRS